MELEGKDSFNKPSERENSEKEIDLTEKYSVEESSNNENEEQSSYRQIFKATSLFGGVQVVTIIIGIFRIKIVAILLGTVGVGIIGLLNSPLELIISITGLGIVISSVRDVSEANKRNDKTSIAKTILTLRRWVWFTGALGAIVTLSLAPLLSEWSFGNRDYTWAFVWLSVVLLLKAISGGQKAILQGTRRLKDMAKASVIGSATGLITSLPLYYFFGTKGIVPALILSALTALILSWYFSRKIPVKKISLSIRETWIKGSSMAKLGISMTLAGFIGVLSSYLLNIFISHQGGIDQVGLYTAGWGVVGQYTGIVFTAMATDYFPRLSAVQTNNLKISKLVSQQGETAILIMIPLLSILILTMPFVVRILYTSAFLPIVMFANLTVLGMQFKALSWCMGYVFLAKGDGKLFLILEIISGAIILFLNLTFYYFLGFNGLGISFIFSYLIGGLIAYSVLRKKYQFRFQNGFTKKVIIAYLLVVFSFFTIFVPDLTYRYLTGGIVFIIATAYTYFKLNQLMDIKQFILSKIKK